MPVSAPRTESADKAVQARALGAYLGLAVGDALGATVEFMTPTEIRVQYGTHDRIRGGGWLGLKPGQVTDDTTMALALGKSILATGGVDAAAAAEAFSDWMAAKPVDIGNTVRRGIVHYRHTGNTETLPSEHDAGNGACMRVLPVALATLGRSRETVRVAVRAQAHVTHNNPLSDAASETVVAMVQSALTGADKRQLLHGPAAGLVEAFPLFAFRGRRRDNPSGYIVETLQAVLQALFDTDDFQSCLIDVVNRGGDADTTGAIAGMIAGALYGPDAIPRVWLTKLVPDIERACRGQAAALVGLAASSY
ncbi:MAG: ADP-ribosyl-[dinitrogen reductase] hydrolase [Gammaproteobacteria bacterium]|jgi:ADP-ribosyl-[dinitrogen reductase] hydrolase